MSRISRSSGDIGIIVNRDMETTKEQIIIGLKYLPYEDKLSVLAVLNQMISNEEKESKYKDMVSKYVGTMENLVGHEFLIGRKRKNVQAKIVLAICLMEEGYSLAAIGRILGVDHSTVSSYKKSWDTFLRFPNMYSDAIKLYNNFKATL